MQTSTPQKSHSTLPRPNQYFQNYDEEPMVDETQSKSTGDNTNGIGDDVIIPRTTNVAARRRRLPTKNAQTCTSTQEQKRKTTKSNGIIRGNTVAGADQIEIDDNQVEQLESNRITTRNRNSGKHENICVRKRLKNSIFSHSESDVSSSSDDNDENEQQAVDVEVHDTDEPTQLATSSTAKASNSSADRITEKATATTTADASRLTHENSKTAEVHVENRSIQMAGDQTADEAQSNDDASNENSSLSNKDDGGAQANKQPIDNISISSASFNLTQVPRKDAPNENRLTKPKTKVGFNTSCLVHEKSTSSENTSHENVKILMKGGKWRRTIVGIRKNKSSQCKFIV